MPGTTADIGLGVSSTLVLVDGLRSTNFPINDDGHNAYVDLNSLPFSLIARIEVLKDGASSSYGADAIGGVVNLILKKHFVGVGGTLTTATSNAVVVRTSQSDLNNPLAGGAVPFADGTYVSNGDTLNYSNYTSLNLNCANGSYTVTGTGARGTGCKHNLEDEYNQIAPLQRKYSINGRLSIRLNDSVEGYVTGSYSNSFVSIKGVPRPVRATQPFGGAASQASSNPDIVLPVYICSAIFRSAANAPMKSFVALPA